MTSFDQPPFSLNVNINYIFKNCLDFTRPNVKPDYSTNYGRVLCTVSNTHSGCVGAMKYLYTHTPRIYIIYNLLEMLSIETRCLCLIVFLNRFISFFCLYGKTMKNALYCFLPVFNLIHLSNNKVGAFPLPRLSFPVSSPVSLRSLFYTGVPGWWSCLSPASSSCHPQICSPRLDSSSCFALYSRKRSPLSNKVSPVIHSTDDCAANFFQFGFIFQLIIIMMMKKSFSFKSKSISQCFTRAKNFSRGLFELARFPHACTRVFFFQQYIVCAGDLHGKRNLRTRISSGSTV